MGDAPITPAVVDEIISFVRDTTTSRYSMLASTVLYVYDLVTTLDKEVDLVWTRPRSFLQVLFIINRYLALFECLFNPIVFLYQGTNLTNSVSENWLKLQSGTATTTIIVVQMILVIRLWAMYGRNRWILISMTTFGALQLIASAIVLGKSMNYAPAIAQLVPSFVVCTTALPPYFTAYWIPIVAFEITLLTLMLVKGWKNFRRQNVTAVSGMTGKSLANLMVRDSMIYFVVCVRRLVTFTPPLLTLFAQQYQCCICGRRCCVVLETANLGGGYDVVGNCSPSAHGKQVAP
ncbi:hypothetical protein BJ138DRAFT_838720 [Hygrophoropsis aurantiaca]|uniref:Uncharacterized protein n=1 Tax=Hygrophoropsis aurantiaca TaxID=72124 RepID=A0ACB7ZVV5_9AGAM|nr:hypothetical protein BJ138DRAFT_838720 [Hygrophoropsis aurantiaca]